MKKTTIFLPQGNFSKKLKFALVSDLHGQNPDEALSLLCKERPDYILLPGDIFERLDGKDNAWHENALGMLRGASEIAPSFYTTGNHEDGGTRSWSVHWRLLVMERNYDVGDLQRIEETGTTFLGDSFVLRDGIAFGGLYSGLINEGRMPNLSWLDEFCKVDAPRVLLCHHPEYYAKYLKDYPIDLIVSGHAHGGQWRIFGRGVFAPGQGLFPKYTAGVHENRLVISTGLKKSGKIPRIFNEPEVVFIELK
ncbi:MAG: metallophosphoesterase [Clostridia bacterium]|nr:metallophosphoesterase [Clostridia bacterium]